jgi:hypothetical protein
MLSYEMTWFLYFLVDSDKTKHRFKIGVSLNPCLRGKTLAQALDLTNSFEMGYRTAKEAFRGERYLHSHFSEYRIDPSEIGACDGKTEWFRLDCYEKVLQLVRGGRCQIPLRPVEEYQIVHLNLDLPSALCEAVYAKANSEGKSIKEVVTSFLVTYSATP